MIVSEQLKKQIIIEILALIFLMGVIIYAVFALQKSKDNKVSSIHGMVVVIDDSKMKSLDKYSDGEGLETEGVKYTVTETDACGNTQYSNSKFEVVKGSETVCLNADRCNTSIKKKVEIKNVKKTCCIVIKPCTPCTPCKPVITCKPTVSCKLTTACSFSWNTCTSLCGYNWGCF